MIPSNIWRFLREHVVSLATVSTGLLTAILISLDFISDKIAISVVLTLLSLLATSEIVEKRLQLAKIEDKLESLPEEITGISVQVLPSIDQVMEYLIQRTETATIQIDQASIDGRRSRNTKHRKRYDEVRRKVIKSDRIRYRYLGTLDSERRLSLVREFVADARCSKFFAAFFGDLTDNVPLLNFVVFDNRELITRYPFEHGTSTVYLVIRSEKVAQLFSGYFDRLWSSAEKVENESTIGRLRQHLSQP